MSINTARFLTLSIEVRPNQRNEKIFSEGGHRKRNPKVIVHIINHIIRGKVVYKTLNSISKKLVPRFSTYSDPIKAE